MDATHNPPAIVRTVNQEYVWTCYEESVWQGMFWPHGYYAELPGGQWLLRGVGLFTGIPVVTE